MAFKLSAVSEKNLAGVHPDLVKVVRRAIQITSIDFRVIQGLRSKAQQAKNVARGASQTMNSRHLTGHAVDVVALDGGKVDWHWPLYAKISVAFKQAAQELNVPIVWGGDWKSLKDGGHFELERKAYPA